MNQGFVVYSSDPTESLILRDVRRSGNYVHASVTEWMGRGSPQKVRGRVVIKVHPMYYEDDPVSIKVESGYECPRCLWEPSGEPSSGDTLRCMRFLGENPEVVRTAIATAMEEEWR